MTSTIGPFECDHLHLPTLPTPHTSSSEQAELVHLNEQISLLDGRISQMNMVRRALYHPTGRPHNQSSACHTLDTDIPSCIFEEVINPTEPASTSTFKNDHLRSNPLPIPSLLSSEQAGPAHPNNEISLLDSQVSQLDTLRHTLHHRFCQLHNQLSPIHVLPIELLSYIFEQVNDSEVHTCPDLYDCRQCIRRALLLGSVSTQFRYVALGTPELWKRVPLELRRTDPETISKALALLQHCITYAPSVNISVSDSLDESKARSAIAVLLTPETTRKIKAFQLYGSACASHLWVEKLNGSVFPMLDVLNINHNVTFDLETLKTVTRLKVSHRGRGPPRTLPPSLLYLDVAHISERELVSFLYQCPNLVECMACLNPVGRDAITQFNKPLTLSHLKRLTLGPVDIIAQPSSAGKFQLPSLEFLHLDSPRKSAIHGIIAFCGNLSTTLTTLIISTYWDTFDSEYLYRLCKIPFPKLRKLEFRCTYFEFFEAAVRALARVDGECCDRETCHLPALKSIILSCPVRDTEPHLIMDLLKEWRIGGAFYYHLVFEYPDRGNDWNVGLDEWRSNVGSRKIEVTWGHCKVQELRAPDGSLGSPLRE